jgi:hypothetical protein
MGSGVEYSADMVIEKGLLYFGKVIYVALENMFNYSVWRNGGMKACLNPAI